MMSQGSIIKDVLNVKLLMCFLPPLRIGLRSGTRQSLCVGETRDLAEE